MCFVLHQGDIPKTSNAILAPELITTTFPSHNPQFMESIQNDWNAYYAFTHLLLKPNASIADLEAKLPAFAKRHLGEETAQNLHYKLMPLTQLHLHGREYGMDRYRLVMSQRVTLRVPRGEGKISTVTPRRIFCKRLPQGKEPAIYTGIPHCSITHPGQAPSTLR